MKPKTLSVLISYRRRLSALRVLAENLVLVDLPEIDFHVVSLGDRDPAIAALCREAGLHLHHVDHAGPFSTGIGHNHGARMATGEYVLKQDVDWLPWVGFYDRLLGFIDGLRRDPRAWANLGVYYCTESFTETHLTGIVTKELYDLVQSHDRYKRKTTFPCGNGFLVDRQHYLELGGTSERFRGWGWEDYQVVYYLEKTLRPEMRLSSYAPSSITRVCRDEIARPKNRATNERDLVFLHRWHDPADNEPGYKDHVEANRRALFDLVTRFSPPRQEAASPAARGAEDRST